ncbi:NUDIX hydrolase [Naumannella halotolerans]|uniref:8-oxo-dGTP diphosphatase n=1 Tax=Naumannella halotolerans TaxID=993414 RepID=A0A4V3EMG1_9ACTN|nr:NUDIX domain-containing protein [Naumannella halotolerans]TDT30008.1 8-oxo-dGTP diphosphatase [Naumannella halotolerans]
MAHSPEPIRAAGAVVIDDRNRVLVVHRPAYDDLTLPKGKLEPGERAELTAVREVREETGVRVALQARLPATHYRLGKRVKQVEWWRAAVLEIGKHRPDREVDEVLWLPLETARRKLTRDDDRATLDAAVEAGSGPALIVLRHGKAIPRKQWKKKRDDLRPLNRRGKAQAKSLIPLLSAYGVQDVISSSSIRCLGTVEPYAKHIGAGVRSLDQLSEEGAEAEPKAVVATMEQLLAEARKSGRPTVICGHRPVLPAMLKAAGLPGSKLPKGSFSVRHLPA